MDEAAEDVEPTDVERHGSGDCYVAGRGNAEADATMRTLLVVMTDVVVKDSFEVATAHDQQPVETFGAVLTPAEVVGHRRIVLPVSQTTRTAPSRNLNTPPAQLVVVKR